MKCGALSAALLVYYEISMLMVVFSGDLERRILDVALHQGTLAVMEFITLS